ncbi:MAG TPA: lysozyme [Reyranella sp.]|nr:lysozyme [Reyranella sp.]
MLHIGPAGIELIKRNEGCELTAYLDLLATRPVWTIGYGDTQNVWAGLRITQAEAEERLARRLAREFEPAVRNVCADVPTTQGQFDAMVSLAWNIGVGRLDDPRTPQDEGSGFRGSSVARYHRAGDYAKAAASFALWNKAGGVVRTGLIRRRAEEAALYARGSGAIEPPAPELSPFARYECAKAMQTALMQAGLYRHRIDGDWGAESRKACDRFDPR